MNWEGLCCWNLVGAHLMLCCAGELWCHILFPGCVLQTGRGAGQTCDWVLGDSRCDNDRCSHTQTRTHIDTSVITAGKHSDCHTGSAYHNVTIESVNTVRIFTNNKPISCELKTAATVKGASFLYLLIFVRVILEEQICI